MIPSLRFLLACDLVRFFLFINLVFFLIFQFNYLCYVYGKRWNIVLIKLFLFYFWLLFGFICMLFLLYSTLLNSHHSQTHTHTNTQGHHGAAKKLPCLNVFNIFPLYGCCYVILTLFFSSCIYWWWSFWQQKSTKIT